MLGPIYTSRPNAASNTFGHPYPYPSGIRYSAPHRNHRVFHTSQDWSDDRGAASERGSRQVGRRGGDAPDGAGPMACSGRKKRARRCAIRVFLRGNRGTGAAGPTAIAWLTEPVKSSAA
ncbi:hypothetical protein C6P74_06805 [Burkholderia multivorans]|nr:hypothetical protein C6P74_06805 [Burkholderia multivorans]PRE85481.1 hypothetical protein C6Q02_11490 [Burkholderia multivorans]